MASSQVRGAGPRDGQQRQLAVRKSEMDAEKTVVLGRGELQIGIPAEQMRREGYEIVIVPSQIPANRSLRK